MRKTLLFLVLMLPFFVKAQNTNTGSNLSSEVQQVVTNIKTNLNVDKLSVGLGLGMNFGGIGGNFMLYPQKNVGLFVGAGYAYAGVGLNAGVKVRFPKKNKFEHMTPYLLAMYGYNAAIHVTNATEYDKFFYGPTVGFGFDWKSHEKARGYWTAAILVPVRSADVQTYMDDLKNNHGVEFKSDLFPVAISIGYRIVLE
ncbi:MAG: hypothetical protein JXR65_03105 [Bacteroidales bacterium]|nr:hypothetical protein [Bacteroidales bacterium]